MNRGNSRLCRSGVCALALLMMGWLAPAIAETRIQHVVITWLKQPGDPDLRQRLIEQCRRLDAIPGVISVVAGEVIPSSRAVVDSSFDVAIVFTLESRKALNDYVDHPLHQEVLHETIRPLVDHYIVYDIQ